MTEPLRSIAAALVMVVVACAGPSPEEPGGPAPEITLVDATAEAGVDFVHENGATEERYLPETMGSGVVVFDADGDDLPDLFFVDSMAVADLAEAQVLDRGVPGRLYRNLGGGRFEDATARSGLRGAFLGMGGVAGDVDNDGDADLLLTGIGGERLFLNDGDGRFEEASEAWNLEEEGFGTSAAFVDIDRDGWLDLLVGRYVQWTPQSDRPCRPDGVHRIYCTPEAYRGAANVLYRNLGGRGFEEVGEEVGIGDPEAKTLGVAVLDLEADLWPDLAIANDTTRNLLYRNRGDGTFDEIGVQSGMALGPSGAPRGAMGIDQGDVDGDGLQDLVIGNFAQEMSSVYRQQVPGLFVDEAPSLGVGLPTLMDLAFGTLLVDLDTDGWLDLVFANGHIEPEIQRFQSAHRYAQPLAVFRNRGRGEFVSVSSKGGASAREMVARGLAAGDFDGDGDLDLVVSQNGGPAVILRNESPDPRSLRLHLAGTSSNRSAFGARVEVAAGDRTILRWLVSGGSYLSQSESVVTVGVAGEPGPFPVTVIWPSGIEQDLGPLEPGPLHRVVEPQE